MHVVFVNKTQVLHISALAALERNLLSERTKIGLKNAKAKGINLGRPKKRNSKLIRELVKQGYSQRQIAQLAGVSKTTVFNELKMVINHT